MTDLLLGSVGMFCALGEGSSWGESGPVGKNIQPELLPLLFSRQQFAA
jgi:hypothetical protein